MGKNMTSPAKNKGNSFEREVAKFLTTIFNEHFNRNISGSGSYIGGNNIYRKQIISDSQVWNNQGDIICPDSFNGKLIIECKFYKDFPFHHFLINKSIPLLDDWIKQQLTIVEDNNIWFIVFKINRVGSYIVIPEKIIDIDDSLGNHSIYYNNGNRYIIAEFESFIKLYKNQIKEKCL